MKAKKWSTLILSCLLLLSSFMGCSGDGGGSGGGSAGDGNNQGGAGEGGEKTITVSQWSAPSDDDELNLYKQFEKANPGYKIDVMVIAEDQYSAKINQMISTNTAPDIVLAWECDIPNFVANNKIVSLDSYLQKSEKVNPDDFIPAVKEMSDQFGGNYALPWCYASEILFYNKDMFDAAKVEYPTNEWTMEDFVDAAEKLTIVDESGRVQQYGCDGLSFVGGWWSGIGAAGDPVYEDGKLVIGDGAKKFLTTQKYLVDNQMSPAPSAESSDLFASGMAAMTRTGSWFLGTYKDLEFNWDIAPQPKDARFYNSLHTGMWCIPESTEDKDAAWKVLEWCMSKDGQTVLSKSSGNISVTKSIAEEGAWKVQGTNGPSNWDAFDVISDSGVFGYVCLPAGLTGDAVKQFEAAVLGQKSIDDAVAEVQAAAEDFS